MSVVACLLLLILTVTEDYKSENPVIKQAVDWQNRTKGIVSISSKLATKFKHESGPGFIIKNGINTIVFGSSTMMTIRSSAFPPPFRVYNFATNSNPLHKTIGELQYHAESNESIRWAIIAVDYGLGFPFEKHPIVPYNLELSHKIVPLKDQIKDAVTLDRLKITFQSLWTQAVQDDHTYPCPLEEDQVGRDFGTVRSPGTCRGYRVDGSATFGLKRMSKLSWKGRLNENGLSRFIKNLDNSQEGEINSIYLSELEKLDRLLKSRDGYLTLILPPLMPGAEVWMLNSPVAPNLRAFKKNISSWASDNQVRIIDSGQSERYNCEYSDFFDQHHALEFCFEKILNHHFK